MEMPYAWAPLVMAGGFALAAVLNGVRFASGEPRPSHAVGLILYGLLALVFGFIAWMAWFGPPLP